MTELEQKCKELAELFLRGSIDYEDMAEDLAARIMEVMDDWLSDREMER